MEKESNNKIGVVTASAMVVVAIIFDLIGSIPVVSIVSSTMSCLVFGTWFYFLGAGLVNPKKIATIGLGFLSKIIPGNILPTTTIGVCAFIFMQNHPFVAKVANKSINTKKQSLNKQVRSLEKTSKKTIDDVRKGQIPIETNGRFKESGVVKPNKPLQSSTTAGKKQNDQDIKNIEYLQNRIPQRRLIRDIDIPAPYGEDIDDELDTAA